MFEPELVVTLAVPAIAVVVWLVRIEGRVNLGEARHRDTIDRLDRIEHKIDRIGK